MDYEFCNGRMNPTKHNKGGVPMLTITETGKSSFEALNEWIRKALKENKTKRKLALEVIENVLPELADTKCQGSYLS